MDFAYLEWIEGNPSLGELLDKHPGEVDLDVKVRA